MARRTPLFKDLSGYSLENPSIKRRGNVEREVEENEIYARNGFLSKPKRAARRFFVKRTKCMAVTLLVSNVLIVLAWCMTVRSDESQVEYISHDKNPQGTRHFRDRETKKEVIVEYLDFLGPPSEYTKKTFKSWSEYTEEWSGCKEPLKLMNADAPENAYFIMSTPRIVFDVSTAVKEIRVRVADVVSSQETLLDSVTGVQEFFTIPMYSKDADLLRKNYPCVCTINLCKDTDSQDTDIYRVTSGKLTFISPDYVNETHDSNRALRAFISLDTIEEMKKPFWIDIPNSITIDYLDHKTLKRSKTTLRDPENIVNFMTCYHFMKSKKFERWEL